MKKRQTVLSTVSLAVGLTVSLSAIASDFDLQSLPSFKAEIDLKNQQGKTFYDLMKSELKNKMDDQRQSENDDDLLKEGKGIAVKLNDQNYNIHVNYFDSPTSGRSYGWTRGQVGDWSDKAILTNMIAIAKGSDQDLKNFYTTLVQLVGSCDASTLPKLKGMAERVATNFLAIYGAEEYRATLGTKNWDDALFESLMLGAFHAGQKTVKKYYMGKFSDRSYQQGPGIYNSHGKPAAQPAANSEKAADLTDYWQCSNKLNPKSPGKCVNSGINETRPDFEKMGEVITAYEKNNADLKAVEGIVKGSGDNVIKDVTQYFVNGQANASATDDLAKHVASLLVQVRADAEKITATAN